MRFALLALAASLALSGCVTTPNEPPKPIELTAGNGAMAMNVSVDQSAGKNYYIFTVAQFDPNTRRVIMEGDSPKFRASFTQSFNLQDAGVGFWKSQLPAGSYAITKIQAKLSTGMGPGQIPYGADPLAVLLVGLTVIAISEATVDELSFINESGLLMADAPTFVVESGRVSYLGKIRVTTDSKSADFPEYDKDGHWDGTSMITKTQYRYMADYKYDELELKPYEEQLNLSAYPLLPQPIEVFKTVRFVLEDYDGVEEIQRSVQREHKSAEITAPAAPAPGALDGKSRAELQRLYLDGALTPSQYEAALKTASQ
ncbi:MAG: hypothetical protein JJ959_10435 [Nisaea sp.]|uniref:hypothetical protein n=1 Tax=Nisaea sp. TaxID=2024842 RepID=UPI001B071E4A|nr:hypothetical protein [Nisaea sp.]MBO6560947.1 hypothetical protein [Nisaea sp.]